MSEWKKVKLGDVCVRVTSGGTPKANITSYYNPPTFPWLKTKEVNYCRITETENYISEEGLANSSAKLIAPNSVIIAMYGQGDTAGRVAINKIPLTTNQACCNLTIDESKADYEFIYYQLCTLYNKMVSLKAGAAQPNLNAQIIKNLEVLLPSLSTQHHIAAILSRYDTLIENYQKQIKLLEEAVQRLYKEWFVDLHFPGHENTKIVDGVPEGWEKKTLGSIVQKSIGGGWGKESRQGSYDKSAYVVRGTDISKLKNGSPDDIPFRYHTDSNLKERVLSDGDIIFEVSGGSEKEPVGRMYYITQQILDFYKERVICASFCKKVSFGDKNSSLLAYYAMQYCRESGDMKKYEKDSAGNIINFAWSTFLDDFIVLVPDKLILGSFCERVQAIINNLVNLSLQIRLLVEARDRLLPKLMSGENEIK